MNDLILEPPSKELCKALLADVKNSQFPIEKIGYLLSTEYTYGQLLNLEPEFIIEHMLTTDPSVKQEEYDSNFITKLYAIVAILNQPLMVTQSLMSFYNTVLVCNNLPSGVTNFEDLRLLPSRYLFRTFLAVNALLPDDMDFTEMYLHPNIKRFIYDCYRADDDLVLDPCFEYLQDDFFRYTYSAEQIERFAPVVKAIKEKLLPIRKIVIHSLKKTNDPAAEDDINLGQTLYHTDDDMLQLRLRLYQNRFMLRERELLNMFPEDSYEGRMVQMALGNLLYGYLFWFTAEKMRDKELILAVDLASIEDRGDGALLRVVYTVASSLQQTSEGSRVEIMYRNEDSKTMKDLFEQMRADRVKELSLEKHKLESEKNSVDEINNYVYEKYGPPNVLVILTSKKSAAESNIKMFKEVHPGWSVYILT